MGIVRDVALLLCSLVAVAHCQPKKSARYGSGSGFSNNVGYDPNFNLMLDTGDLNSNGNGYSQTVKVSLPNPPRPPLPPKPMRAPMMGNYETDPNRIPAMPRPMGPPSGFGPMDIQFNFPSYEPSVDDTFFDSDSGGGYDDSSFYGNGGGGYNNGGYNNKRNGNNGNNYNNNGNNNNNGNGWASSVQNMYGSTTRVSAATTTAAAATSTAASTSTTGYGNGGSVGGSSGYGNNGGSSGNNGNNGNNGGSSSGSGNYGNNGGSVGGGNYGNNGGSVGGGSYGSATTLSPVANGAPCTPQSNLNAQGKCWATSMLKAQCTGMQMSASRNCSSKQFCCFQSGAAAATTAAPAGTTSAASATATTSAASVATTSAAAATTSTAAATTTAAAAITTAAQAETTSVAQVETTAAEASAETTANGAAVETTTVPAEEDETTVAAADTTVAVDEATVAAVDTTVAVDETTVAAVETTVAAEEGEPRRKSNQKGCRPASNLNAAGFCLGIKELPDVCKGRAASKSSDCEGNEWCCISEEAAGVKPVVQKPVADSGSRGRPPLPIPALPESQSSGVAVAPPVKPAEPVAARKCAPSDKLSAQGFCGSMLNLMDSCTSNNKRMSPSKDCPAREFCCYEDNEPATAAPVNLPAANQEKPNLPFSSVEQKQEEKKPVVAENTQGKACKPNVDSKAIGECMTVRDLSSKCGARKASPSLNCSMGSWCCYMDEVEAEPLMAKLNLNVLKAEALAVQPPVEVPEKAAESSNVVVNDNEASCSPNSAPKVTDGFCLQTRELRTRCKNKRVSKSSGCKAGQWCCFNDPSNPLQVNLS